MTKNQVANIAGAKAGVDSKTAEDVIDGFIYAIKKAAETGESVFMRGFGSFVIRTRAAKIARNIAKGTAMPIPAKNIVHFKPSKEFVVKQPETETDLHF